MNGWLAWFVFVVIGTGVWMGAAWVYDRIANYYWEDR